MGQIVELVQGTPEWHAWRRSGIGGSDAPVVEGISPYRTLRQLYFEKKNIQFEADEDGNEFIFGRGHAVEALIRKSFQEKVKTEMNPACMRHDKYSHLLASLDGFDKKKYGVLEAKLVGQETLKQARDGHLPDHHYSQMQHQMEVSGADVGQWYGHDGKKNGVLLTVERNDEYIKRLVDGEHRFWEALLAGKVPDLSERDYLIPEDLALLEELRNAKELAENAKIHFENLKEKIVNTYGGHPRIGGAGVKLFRVQRQGSLNILNVPEVAKAAEAAKALLDPSYLEGFRGKPVESWTLRIDTKA